MTLDALMPDEHEMAALLADTRVTPEESAIQQQDEQRLQQAVLKLPPQHRLILVLHDMEELETAEIAKITDLKEGTVRVRLHRARLLLRRELAQPSSRGASAVSCPRNPRATSALPGAARCSPTSPNTSTIASIT